MQIHTSLDQIPSISNAVITIGSFDGVHKGHQKLISRIRQLATEVNGESVVLTFHPHPRKVIYPNDNSLALLNSRQEQINLFRKFGVDHLVIIPFTIEFSQQKPKEYIENFLFKYFTPKYIVIGYDHRFGLNRSGNIEYLKSYEEQFDFSVIEIEKQEIEDIAISSTKIRNAIANNEMQKARSYLGYAYLLSGKVIHGEKIGTKIGYSTANIELDEEDKLLPADGIYAVRVKVVDTVKDGMLYIGNKPTIHNEANKTIEVHIFDFNQYIYDQPITLKIIEFLRHDQKFDSIDDLKKALALDEINAKNVLANHKVKTQSDVAIAILNYNGQEILESYLPSTLYSSSSNVKFYLIDNASTDDSVDFVEKWHPEYELISLQKNHGYAGGYNIGLKQLNEKYIALINSDIQCTENWLDPIIALMESDESIAAVQPKIRSIEEPHKFEYAGASGGFIDFLGYPFCRGRLFSELEEDNGQYDDAKEIFWASGAAFVVRKDIFDKLGGFDADFFAHQEEIDLCWRMKNAGYKIKCEPKSLVYHLGGGTLDYENPKKTYLNFRNNLTTIIKNEQNNWILKFILRLFLDGVAGLKFILDGHLRNAIAIVKAHWNVIPSIGKQIAKRKQTKQLVKKHKIGTPNTDGYYQKSIVVQFFIKKNKTYSQLP